jgi:hypothetical protein
MANQVPSRSVSMALQVAVRAPSSLAGGEAIEAEQSSMSTSTASAPKLPFLGPRSISSAANATMAWTMPSPLGRYAF